MLTRPATIAGKLAGLAPAALARAGNVKHMEASVERGPFYRSRNFATFVAIAALIFLGCAAWGNLGIPATLATGFMYLFGSQWVYGFIDKRTMFAPYTGVELSYKPNDPGRIGLFILGVFAMVSALISVAGVLHGS